MEEVWYIPFRLLQNESGELLTVFEKWGKGKKKKPKSKEIELW